MSVLHPQVMMKFNLFHYLIHYAEWLFMLFRRVIVHQSSFDVNNICVKIQIIITRATCAVPPYRRKDNGKWGEVGDYDYDTYVLSSLIFTN